MCFLYCMLPKACIKPTTNKRVLSSKEPTLLPASRQLPTTLNLKAATPPVIKTSQFDLSYRIFHKRGRWQGEDSMGTMISGLTVTLRDQVAPQVLVT